MSELIQLTVDGLPVQMPAGTSLLQAAARLGIDIPTLCHLEQCTPATSCLVCLVKVQVNGQSRMVPACATKVQPGQIVESETSEVHEARRTALELLLSDHCGDCLSPCHRICPLHLNIPVMLRQIEAGQLEQAIVTVRSALPLPAVLGRLCHHPCESGCRRGVWDQPAAIRELECHVADTDLRAAQPYLPPVRPRTGKSIVIVGSGPTGLAAASSLLQWGHACTIVDRHPEAGGSLRSQVDASTLPREVLDQELALLRRLGLQFKLGVEFGTVVTLEGLQRGFDVVLLALGELAGAEVKSFGVELTPAGIRVNPVTHQTSVPNVFAAGSAVRNVPQVVRAMAEGQGAASSIHQYLTGRQLEQKSKPFSSIMGKVPKDEVGIFAQLASGASRLTPQCQGCAGFSTSEAPREAARCLHCDCRAAGHCKLQEYAQRYHADPGRFRELRRPFEQYLQRGDVLFEPGKCILCGICVQLAEKAREPLGLTFIGRGFNVRLATPFHGSIADGLQKVAAECVRHCPTGALVFRSTGKAPAAPQSAGTSQNTHLPHVDPERAGRAGGG